MYYLVLAPPIILLGEATALPAPPIPAPMALGPCICSYMLVLLYSNLFAVSMSIACCLLKRVICSYSNLFIPIFEHI